MQTQLRNRLVAELKDAGLSRTFVQHSRGTATGGGRLLQRAADSLVVDHLRCNNYNYALSIFQPECGLPDEVVSWFCLSLCLSTLFFTFSLALLWDF